MLHAQDSRRNLSSTPRLPPSDNKGIVYYQTEKMVKSNDNKKTALQARMQPQLRGCKNEDP